MPKVRRTLVSFTEGERGLIDTRRGNIPFATWVREAAIREASRAPERVKEASYDFSDSQA